MKRKKYIKQLMALGYDRNEANRSANIARVFSTYERALEIEKQSVAIQKGIVKLTTTMTDWLTSAVEKTCEAIARMSEAIAYMIEEFKGLSVAGKPLIDWAAENALLKPDPQWPKQNPNLPDGTDLDAIHNPGIFKSPPATGALPANIRYISPEEREALMRGGGGND